MLARIAAAMLVLAGLGQLVVPLAAAHTCGPDEPWGGGEDVRCGPCDPSVVIGHKHNDYYGTHCQSDPCTLTDVICAISVIRNAITAPSNF